MDRERVTEASFREKLDEVIGGVGEKELVLDLPFLEEYCKLTGHDLSLYRARDRVPLGFLMTFTGPIFSEMFIAFFTKHPGVIKGVIHTTSKVELFAPFRLGAGRFRESLAVRNIEEKAGRKGRYFAVDFEIVLVDGDGVKVASDVHQFFLKI